MPIETNSGDEVKLINPCHMQPEPEEESFKSSTRLLVNGRELNLEALTQPNLGITL